MLTVGLAVAAAACNALASVCQRLGARRLADGDSDVGFAAVVRLLRRPLWLCGFGAMLGAFVLQALALRHGDLGLVQPLLLAELPITLLFAGPVFRVAIGRRAWLGALGMVAGLAGVLFSADVRGGSTHASLVSLLLTLAAASGAVVALTLVAHRLRSNARAAAFATGAGIGFALTAAMMKKAVQVLGSEGSAVFSAWELYAMAAGGLASLYLWQKALLAGNLVAAQPAITISDPVVATTIGVLVFAEQVRLGWWLVPELVGATLVVLGSIELARSPLVSGQETGA